MLSGRSFESLIIPDLHVAEKNLVKYRGVILHVTSPALGSDDLSLDQSGRSIQILLEPNAGHMTRFL